MKPTQVFMKRVIPSCLLILVGLSLTTNQAYAGGYDDPGLILPEEESVVIIKSIPAILSWDKWEKPYVSGGNLCRRKNSDVVCLPIEMAKKVGVHIYSPKKPKNSPPVKGK